jgi:serine/threonine protein kinase/tetratricopeptide (TPR) repeat protein
MNLDTIFAQAIEIESAPERAAFLEGACRGDPELRRAVEQLVRDHFRAGAFLERPAAHLAATALGPAREGPGAAIGPYKLLEQIGEGGFGVVFMAEQQQPVRRKVALKVIKPGMDTRQVIARFEAERQALAVMDHPHIATVLDAGETASGRPYFVMELVKGVPLTDYCDQAHLVPRQRLELFLSVCQAVQHAHQKGIIHRDLKPSNVLVSAHDGRPAVKVIDFGIAKAAGGRLTDKTLFTGFAQLIGTPLYMSPEQAGQSQDIDTRSDIYSLGVLLYELLTGTTPFDKERFREAAYDDICRIIREEEPPRPSTRLSESKDTLPSVSARRQTEPARLTRLVRGELDWIVMKALEKDRNRRYETASAFAADVQRYLNDEPVGACPPSAGYRLRKFARRNRGRLAAAAGVALTVAVMAASIGWAVRDRAARRAETERAESARRAKVEDQVRAYLNKARTLIDENKLAAAREQLAQARAQLANDGPALGNLAAEVAAGAADLDRFQQFQDLIDRAHQAEAAPFLEAALAAGDSRGSMGTLALAPTGERRPAAAVPFLLKALQCFNVLESDDLNSTLKGGLLGRQQVEQIRRLAYEELLWLADDVLRREQEHRSGGKLSPEAAARQALLYLGKAEGAHRPTQPLYALRARCHEALGEEAAAQADVQRADQTPAMMALDHFLRGQAAYDAKQLEEGVRAFEAALRLEPTHYWSMLKLGHCLCDLGRRPEDITGAVRVFTGCILKRPDHAHAYFGRSTAYSKLGRYEEAVADSSKAIELDPQHALAWNSRGVGYQKLGQPGKALNDFSRAVELDPKHAPAWNNRGVAHFQLSQLDKAFDDFSTALDLDPTLAMAWNNRGLTYNKQNRPDKALDDYSRAIELAPNDPELVQAYLWRAQAHSRVAHFEQARTDYETFLERSPAHDQAHNALAFLLATCPDVKLRDPHRAVELARKAVRLAPQTGNYWMTLGVAHYRAGNWEAAVAALDESVKLRPGGDVMDRLFLAMAHEKLGNHDEARRVYEQAGRWLDMNQAALTKGHAGVLRRLRAEAEGVLELKKK